MPPPRFVLRRARRAVAYAWLMIALLIVGCSRPVPPGAANQDSKLREPTRPTGSSDRVASDTANLASKLRGVFPDEPLVLSGAATAAFAATADGSRAALANGLTVEFWDLIAGRRLLSMKHPTMLVGLAIAPDERTLLTVAAGGSSPVRLWSLQDGTLLREYPSPFPDRVAAARGDRDSRYWYAPGHLFPSPTGYGFTSVAFSPTSEAFVTGCESGDIIVWNTTTGTGQSTAHMSGTSHRLFSVVFSPKGDRILACSLDRTVQLWDAQTGTILKEYPRHNDQWFAGVSRRVRIPFAFSPDGRRFAFFRNMRRPGESGRTFVIHLCDANSGDELRQLRETGLKHGHEYARSRDGCVAFLPSERILTNAGAVLDIWDVQRGQITHRYTYKSAVNPYYAHPQVEYVRYLPRIAAVMLVEVENDEGTLHDDWTIISLVSLSQFEEAPADQVRENQKPEAASAADSGC